MPISSVSSYSAMSESKSKEFAGRGPTRVIGNLCNSYETSYQRMARVRNSASGCTNRQHAYDQILAHPERFKSRTLRGLIHVSRLLEELGENTADISGLTERTTRNIISSGEKFDMAKVMSSALGRVVSAQLSMFGFALHKAVGASFYLLSTTTSIAVIAFASSRYAKLRQPDEMRRAMMNSSNSHSMYLLIARKLLTTKEYQLEKILTHTDGANNPIVDTIRQWTKQLSRNHRAVPEYMVNQRKAHSSYILNNLHQYGPLTRGLMQFSYATFQGVNKLLVSFDKHIGTEIGRRLLAKHHGQMLGCRVALTAAIAASTALSVPMAPLTVGLSMIGAIACGFALVALILAKVNVNMCDDWKGNICDTKQIRFSAA
ncbi:hypothetical protein [Limnobacter parvus]|uniref:Uncharacterized protein n=1 Tax=Limnobacter parvus TaxID=2939690 RepID=A0ABT1XID7_9BURK|nr:hypothetical protein [Limnobacter parvus]MCR2747051.1 hypothetical protein [Limnobacter parvus]